MPQNDRAQPPVSDSIWSQDDTLLEEMPHSSATTGRTANPSNARGNGCMSTEMNCLRHPEPRSACQAVASAARRSVSAHCRRSPPSACSANSTTSPTVSGGGYIGAWLATIMHGGGKGNGALSAAIKALTEPADPALRSLRNYTNFPDPRRRIGSSDTWSAIVLWLRNVLLNWLVFGPILLALAIVPLLYRELLWDVASGWGVAALIAALLCLLLGTVMVCRSVPTHAYDGATGSPTGGYGAAASTVQRWVVTPILLWAFLAPLWFSAAAASRSTGFPSCPGPSRQSL